MKVRIKEEKRVQHLRYKNLIKFFKKNIGAGRYILYIGGRAEETEFFKKQGSTEYVQWQKSSRNVIIVEYN